MSETPAGNTSARQAGDGDANGSEGMPRWVRVTLIIGAVLVLLVGVMLALGHGPGQHGHALRAAASKDTAAALAAVRHAGGPSRAGA